MSFHAVSRANDDDEGGEALILSSSDVPVTPRAYFIRETIHVLSSNSL